MAGVCARRERRLCTSILAARIAQARVSVSCAPWRAALSCSAPCSQAVCGQGVLHVRRSCLLCVCVPSRHALAWLWCVGWTREARPCQMHGAPLAYVWCVFLPPHPTPSSAPACGHLLHQRPVVVGSRKQASTPSSLTIATAPAVSWCVCVPRPACAMAHVCCGVEAWLLLIRWRPCIGAVCVCLAAATLCHIVAKGKKQDGGVLLPLQASARRVGIAASMARCPRATRSSCVMLLAGFCVFSVCVCCWMCVVDCVLLGVCAGGCWHWLTRTNVCARCCRRTTHSTHDAPKASKEDMPRMVVLSNV
jgi:hypothetical protein